MNITRPVQMHRAPAHVARSAEPRVVSDPPATKAQPPKVAPKNTNTKSE